MERMRLSGIEGASRQFKLLRKAGVPFKVVYNGAVQRQRMINNYMKQIEGVKNNATKEGEQQESNSGEHSGTDSVGQEA